MSDLSVFKDGFRHYKINRACYFDVFSFAFTEVYFTVACIFDNGGDIGKSSRFRALICFKENIGVKNLGCLDQAQRVSVDKPAVLARGLPHGIIDGDNRNGAFEFFGFGEQPGNAIFGDQWSYAVVYRNKAGHCNVLQSVFHRLVACFSACDNGVRYS